MESRGPASGDSVGVCRDRNKFQAAVGTDVASLRQKSKVLSKRTKRFRGWLGLL